MAPHKSPRELIEARVPLTWSHDYRCQTEQHSCDDDAPDDPSAYMYEPCRVKFEHAKRERDRNIDHIIAILSVMESDEATRLREALNVQAEQNADQVSALEAEIDSLRRRTGGGGIAWTVEQVTNALYEATSDPHDIDVPDVARRLVDILAAQRGGKAVDREALARLLDPLAWVPPSLGTPHAVRAEAQEGSLSLAERVLDFLAARGDAAPTEVEWGVRYSTPKFGQRVSRTDRQDDAESAAAATGGAVVQRTVSAWREVQP